MSLSKISNPTTKVNIPKNIRKEYPIYGKEITKPFIIVINQGTRLLRNHITINMTIIINIHLRSVWSLSIVIQPKNEILFMLSYHSALSGIAPYSVPKNHLLFSSLLTIISGRPNKCGLLIKISLVSFIIASLLRFSFFV